jgi:hypothetical protein
VSEPRLISVRTELVMETLVGRIVELVLDRSAREAPPAAAGGVLERAPETVPERPGSAQLARRLAIDGYFARVVETELFEPARRPVDWLAASVEEEDAAAVCLELALAEPVERPDPGDERAASWRVPGPGGHVRHYVVQRLIEQRAGPELAEGGAELKRAFVYGLLVRCCEDAPSAR